MTLPIEPTTYTMREIDRDVVIRNMSPSSEIDSGSFTIAQEDQRRQFRIEATGIFDSPPDSEAYKQDSQKLRKYIDENLRVWVDVSELKQDGGTSVPLRWWFPVDWRKQVFPSLEGPAELLIEPVGDPLVKLTPKP